MIDFLMAVPGKLTTLSTRLSSTWAAKLDTLETRLSATRAVYLDKLNLAGKCTDDAVWTNALAAKLALTEKPPIAGSAWGAAFQYTSASYSFAPNGFSNASTASATFVDVVNITGSGVLELCCQLGTNGTGTAYLEIIIDGVTVVSTTNSYSATYPKIACPVGQTVFVTGKPDIELFANGRMKFETSLQIRHKRDTAGNSYVYYKHQKWS